MQSERDTAGNVALMLKLMLSHASRFALLVTPEPNLPLIVCLNSSTNWAGSSNWSCDLLGFLVLFFVVSIVSVVELDRAIIYSVTT